MYLIALTGNIASGKSTVSEMLAQLGARVIDADRVAHAVLLRGTRAWRGVVDAFGYAVLHDDGSVDRRKLGAVVFANPAQLKTLEALTHPAVGTELGLIVRDALAAPNSSESVMVIEAVKLYEAGLHRFCDALWVVTTPPAEQKRRLMQERALSAAEAEARLSAQPPLEDKLQHAQVVIDNGGSIQETRVQVMRAFVQIDPKSASDKTALLLHWLRIPSAAPAISPASAISPAPVTAPSLPLAPEPAPSSVPAEPIAPPAPPTAPVIELSLTASRVRPGDADKLAQLLTQIEGRDKPLSRAEVLERLGKLGYWLVQANGAIAALAAWQAENLVAVVRELWVRSPDLAPRALSLLFDAIEREANALTCEVVVIVAPAHAAELAQLAADASGYKPIALDALHRLWRSVIEPTLEGGEQLYGKQLREMVTKPI